MDRKQFISDLISGFANGTATLSYSSLSKFMESPSAFINYKMKAFEQTDAMIQGIILHKCVFEPEEAKQIYVTDEDICKRLIAGGAKSPRSTNDYKQWKAEQGMKGLQIVSSDVMETIREQAEAVRNNDASKVMLSLMDGYETEEEFIYRGFKFKVRRDAIGEHFNCDLKSTKDANPRLFQREIVNRKYYAQCGLYSLIDMVDDNGKIFCEPKPFGFIAVDKSLQVSTHEMSEAYIYRGIREIDKALDNFERCLGEDLFHQSHEFYQPDGVNWYMVDVPTYL